MQVFKVIFYIILILKILLLLSQNKLTINYII